MIERSGLGNLKALNLLFLNTVTLNGFNPGTRLVEGPQGPLKCSKRGSPGSH